MYSVFFCLPSPPPTPPPTKYTHSLIIVFTLFDFKLNANEFFQIYFSQNLKPSPSSPRQTAIIFQFDGVWSFVGVLLFFIRLMSLKSEKVFFNIIFIWVLILVSFDDRTD